jgi:hypothetical protein
VVAVGAGVGVALVAVALMTILPNIGAPRAAPKPAPVAAPPPQLEPTVAPIPTQDVLPTSVPTLAAPSGIQAPAVQPVPTAGPPTPTSIPVATREAAPPAASANSLVDVRFAAGSADGWVDNDYAAWSDGAYRLQARDPAHFVAVGVPINQVLNDVIVSATFRKTGGPPGGGYGIIVRDQGPEPRDGANQKGNMYVAETGDLGEFGVWRRDGDHWVDLVPWTASSVVRPGGSPNDLMVRVVGDTLTFLVNGTQLANVQDATFPSGGVGLFVGGDYNEVALDRFSVQIPQ